MISAIKGYFFFGVARMFVSVSSKEVDLMDTRRATTDLNWITSPHDGWNELSGQDETGETYRTFQVCNRPNQRNWLETNTVKINEGVRNAYVEIKFNIRPCQDPSRTATCRETFNLYYTETNASESRGKERHLAEKHYKQIDTVAADQKHGLNGNSASVTTRKIDHLSSNGIRLGILDTGACMIIYYVRIYYKQCDATVQSLARFPTTSSGPSTVSLVKSQGECVTNAVWIGLTEGPSLYCNAKGEWQLPKGACQCQSGYESNADMTGCVLCRSYTYKPNPGNRKCSKCPSYSSSNVEGSTKCNCNSGYFRAIQDKTSAPCTRPPSKPRNVYYRVKDKSVDIEWSRPIYSGGRNDIYYKISCDRCDSAYTHCSKCDRDVTYVPDGPTLLQPQVSVTRLWPHTHYRFTIYSCNGVSEVSGKAHAYVEAKMKTSEAVPSTVRSVRVISSSETDVFLTWQAPKYFEGVIQDYEVHISSKLKEIATLSRSYTTSSVTLLIEDLPTNETFNVKVRAQNEAGYGPFSSAITVSTTPSFSSAAFRPMNVGNSILLDFPKEMTSSKSVVEISRDYSLTAVIVSIVCVVIIAALVGYFFVRFKQRREKFGCEDVEVYPFFEDPAVLLQQQKEHLFYVDPTSYADINQAMVEFAREIDCCKIRKGDSVVEGTFGVTCKGFLRPSSFIYDDTITTATSLKPSNLSVTIKILRENATEKERTEFLEEAIVMGQFNHPNVVRLEGVVSRSVPVMIVTELMENGSLHLFLESFCNSNTDIDTTRQLHMLHDIAEGMRYLSQMGFVHKNLSTDSVLVNNQLVCKISNFCPSKPMESIEDDGVATLGSKSTVIPIICSAPEAISEQIFSSASDVWSFGVLTWEVLTVGDQPYWDMTNRDIIYFTDCGYRLPPPPFCPRIFHNIMLNCSKSDPTQRPTFNQIVTRLDSVVTTPERLQDTINNKPRSEQPECVPQLLDISSLCRWLEDMNMDHYRDIILRHGCVTADQIINLSTNQLDEMGITDSSMQRILLEGSELLRQRLQIVNSIGIGITV